MRSLYCRRPLRKSRLSDSHKHIECARLEWLRDTVGQICVKVGCPTPQIVMRTADEHLIVDPVQFEDTGSIRSRFFGPATGVLRIEPSVLGFSDEHLRFLIARSLAMNSAAERRRNAISLCGLTAGFLGLDALLSWTSGATLPSVIASAMIAAALVGALFQASVIRDPSLAALRLTGEFQPFVDQEVKRASLSESPSLRTRRKQERALRHRLERIRRKALKLGYLVDEDNGEVDALSPLAWQVDDASS